MSKKVHWGIIGLGKIAHKFAADLQRSETAILHAVASRSQEKATDFAASYNAINAYGSYEELVRDSKIEVVYIATPHTFHFDNTMLCLHHGKGVLCEKPLGIHLTQVQKMIKEAKAQKVFLMEAIWTRFMPAIEKMKSLLDKNVIGDIVSVHADFGFRTEFDPKSRLYNKSLSGGSLLDIGLYPIFLSLLVLGMPSEINAMARMTSTEVDLFCAMLFNYTNESKAVLLSTLEADTPTEAFIHGTKGSIKLHRRFHQPNAITLSVDGEKTVFDLPYSGNGYLHEIEEVHRCIVNGLTESKKLPLTLSENLSKIIDEVKLKIGLHYDV